MKTYKEILNNKSIQQIRLITIHNILKDVDMNLLRVFFKFCVNTK